jgi:riboflavin kinase/FMN adenylyltransferase
MELIRFEFGKKYNLGNLCVALGEFDGLHLAHQTLIKRAIKSAGEINAKSAVISFDPHPDFILKKRENQGYLTPLNTKIRTLKDLGVDYFILIPFTLSLSKLPYEEFESTVLDEFSIKKLIVGFDYRYGFKGSGNTETLKKKYNVEVIDKILFKDEKMGSNSIREFLLAGRMDDVASSLGRYYNITGLVVGGNQVGRTIGIRTANINIDIEYQVLRKGIYGVIVEIKDKKYLGVCNIGNNPTLNYVEIPRLEVHILDFDETIYNEIISVDFVVFLRDEIKYDNKDELIKQINLDIENTRKLVEIK